MTSRLIFCALLSMLLLHPASAQEDTAHHRAFYEETNKKLGSFKTVKATHKDDELVFELKGWMDGAAVRKIAAAVPGEDGDGMEEYYLENGSLLFAWRQYHTADPDTGKAGARVEDRFYFKDGKLVKWLGADKKPVPADSQDFAAEAERLTSNCRNFLAAFNAKAGAAEKPAGTGKEKAGAEKPKAGAAKTTEGTFLGIEEGDYFHWQMRTAGGGEVSYFILKADASVDKVLEKPDAFKGKKCRVTWKESTETIPEAGGKMKVQQILSVEWLEKK